MLGLARGRAATKNQQRPHQHARPRRLHGAAGIAQAQRAARGNLADLANLGEQLDPTALARAEAAYDFEFARFNGQILALERDESLTPDQRAAAISALRQQQGRAARGARQRVLEEAQQNLRARRKRQRELAELCRHAAQDHDDDPTGSGPPRPPEPPGLTL